MIDRITTENFKVFCVNGIQIHCIGDPFFGMEDDHRDEVLTWKIFMSSLATVDHSSSRARQLYKNISMLFLFPIETVSLVQASMHNVSYCVTVSLQ